MSADTTIDYRTFLDRPAPVVTLDGPDLHTYPAPGSERDKARDAADAAANRYAALTTAQTAALLRKAFGDSAERALFDTRWDDDEREMELLAVYDSTGQILWYDVDSDLWGTLAVRDRDEAEAYGGPVLPVLNEEAKRAIQHLAVDAEDTTDGWLDEVTLVVGKTERDGEPVDLWFDGELRELVISQALTDAAWHRSEAAQEAAGTPLDGAPIGGLLDRLRQHLATYRSTDDAETANDSAEQIANAADALVKALQIRAYEPSPDTDDRLEQVVVSLYGVDLSIRGRAEDLFVHVDSSDRDADDAIGFPLVVGVNDASEDTYHS